MIFFRQNKRYTPFLLLSGAVFLLLALFVGVSAGSTYISPLRVVGALFGAGEMADINIIRYVRLPRTFGSLLCGGALALSGAVLQSVLGNKLASPSVIGVNSGAGLFVTLGCALGIIGGWELSLFAFAGALLTTLFVGLSIKKFGASGGTVILIGVALNALLGGATDLLITIDSDLSILSSDFKIGGFSGVTYERLIPAAFIIVISFVLLLCLSSQLEILTLGEERAGALGLRTDIMSIVFLVLSSLLASAAVSVCGVLSFVGLLVPHALRRFSGGKLKVFLPLCFLFGAGFVSLCDTASRFVFAPYEIPVGIIMAFMGAPFFLFILIKRKRGSEL